MNSKQKKGKSYKTYSIVAPVLAFFATFSKEQLYVLIGVAGLVVILAILLIVSGAKNRKMKRAVKRAEKMQSVKPVLSGKLENIGSKLDAIVNLLSEMKNNNAQPSIIVKEVSAFAQEKVMPVSKEENLAVTVEEKIVEAKEETPVPAVEIAPVVAEEEKVANQKIEEPTVVAVPEPVVEKVDNNAFGENYDKSFMAKYIQSSDESKAYYTALKNAILSYEKTNSRVSWNCDTVSIGRDKLVKFNVRGKTLIIYYALDVEKYNDGKYKVEQATGKKYEGVRCSYKITSDRRLKYALELIEELAKEKGLNKIEDKNDDYYLPYEETEALIEKGLIKKQ